MWPHMRIVRFHLIPDEHDLVRETEEGLNAKSPTLVRPRIRFGIGSLPYPKPQSQTRKVAIAGALL